MKKNFHLYMDDSGTRHPDHNLRPESETPDWFGLGGILVHEDDIDACREAHFALYAKWTQMGTSPLHSEEIRHSKKIFDG